MDIKPVRPGTCLIVPKSHVDHFVDIDDITAQHIMAIAQRIGRRMREVFRPEQVGMVVHGYGVAHAHLILVPMNDKDDVTSKHFAFIEDGRICFGLKNVPMSPRELLDVHAGRLKL